MTRQLAYGRDENEYPRPRIGSNSALTADCDGALGVQRGDLGVHHGESDPARMLSGVLVLAAVTICIVLALVGWLV